VRRQVFFSFARGMGSVLQIYPARHVYSIPRVGGELTDAQRLASDWDRVGHAMYSVIGSGKLMHHLKAKESPIVKTKREFSSR
jgi:hypothetical protein